MIRLLSRIYVAVMVVSFLTVNFWQNGFTSAVTLEKLTLEGSNRVLYADGINVTFDSQGGSAIMPETPQLDGTIAFPPVPIKCIQDTQVYFSESYLSETYYYFDGWYTSTNYTTPWNFDDIATPGMTLYAKWTTGPRQTYAAYTYGDFTYSLINNNMEAVIDGYFGPGGELVIPETVPDPMHTDRLIPVVRLCWAWYAYPPANHINEVTSATVPDSVREINYFFNAAPSYSEFALADVHLGNGVKAIDKATCDWGPFYLIGSLKNINLPEGLLYIGDGSFNASPGLEHIVIPDTVTHIGSYAFSCGLKEIVIPDSVTSLGQGAFASCTSLSSVTIGKGVQEIPYDCFWNDPALTGIVIPDNVTRIGPSAFGEDVNLSFMQIGNNVTTVGNGNFSGPIKTVVFGRSINVFPVDIADSIHLNGVHFIMMGNAPDIPGFLSAYGEDSFYCAKGATGYDELEWLDVGAFYRYDPTALDWNAPVMVRFNLNGATGDTPYDQDLYKGVYINKPIDPTRNEYSFGGWCTEASCQHMWNFGNPAAGDMTLYARWTVNQYTVHFDGQGGTPSESSITTGYNTKITAPTPPKRNGYTFGGWYGDKACTDSQAWNFDTNTVIHDMTLYAKWMINCFTVTFNSQGGSDVASEAANYNTTISVPAAPIRMKYTFAGWYKDDTCMSAWSFATDVVTANITLYAKWMANVYTVTFNSQGGNTVASKTANYNTTITTPTVPTRTGYTFGGWFREPACTNAWNFSTDLISDNITLYAKWTAQTPSAYLSGIRLSVGSLSPSFKSAVTSYTVNLREGDKGVTVTPVKAYDKAMMTINGAKVKSRTVTVANGKSTTVTVKLTNGKTSRTYRLTIRRPKSTNNRLASLKASAGTLSPAFDPARMAYTLTLPENTGRVTITAAKASGLASVAPASKAYTLKPGQTVKAAVKVKSQSGATRTYTVTIKRAKSTNAKLSALKTNVRNAPLTPVFKSGTKSYTVTLPAKTASVTLSWKAADALGKTFVNGKAANSLKVSLKNGQSKTVTITVKAQAGNLSSYVIVLWRK